MRGPHLCSCFLLNINTNNDGAQWSSYAHYELVVPGSTSCCNLQEQSWFLLLNPFTSSHIRSKKKNKVLYKEINVGMWGSGQLSKKKKKKMWRCWTVRLSKNCLAQAVWRFNRWLQRFSTGLINNPPKGRTRPERSPVDSSIRKVISRRSAGPIRCLKH